MRILIVRWSLFTLFWLTNLVTSPGQSIPSPKLPFCTIPELTDLQKQHLQKQFELVLQRQKNARLPMASSVTYVPIRPHIFRRSDGSGGFDVGSLNLAMARTNYHFSASGTGIQFYFCGDTPDYIDNDAAYNNFDLNRDQALLVDVRNALNQYYTNFSSNFGAFAYYPADDLTATRSFIPTAYYSIENQLTSLVNYTIPHELGHNFSLYHTHSPNFSTDELVTRGAGANCTTAGDLLCDTPADPYNLPGATIEAINGCSVYTGTITDANGDAYTPPIYNFMSYYPYYPTCRDYEFTPGQVGRMQQGLYMRQHFINCSIDCPPTAVASPTNLSVIPTASAVLLTWQDNATNEMGYFIERSSSAQLDPIPINGVGPNTTTFTDTSIIAGVTYYYRVRPSNTTTGSLSTTVKLEGGLYTLKAGSWNDPDVWSFSQIPTATDAVHIRHAVSVPSNYEAKAQQLIYESPSEVTFETGAHLVVSQ